MRRGDVYRFRPLIARAGITTTCLIVSADFLNIDQTIAVVYAVRVVPSNPGPLLGVRVGDAGWALSTEVDRLPRGLLVEHLGRASDEEMEQVDNAIRATFDV